MLQKPLNQKPKWRELFANFEKIFSQLQKGLEQKQLDHLQRRGLIHYFEFNFELSWKILQDYLTVEKGYPNISGPRPTFQQAFQDGILYDDTKWLEMLETRNQILQLYDEAQIQQLLKKIRDDYYFLFFELKVFIDSQKD